MNPFPTRVLKNQIVFRPTSVQQAAQLKSCVPALRAGRIDGTVYCSVPLTLEASRLLRNLGVTDAPSPIRTRYDWPIRPGRTPRKNQVETAEFFTLNPRAHCHDDPRLGKTLASLWAIDYLQCERIIQKAIVIAPLSTLERAWGDEIFWNMPRKKHVVLYGSSDKRRKLLKEDADIYVINHDGVQILLPELMKRHDIDLIVIDELTAYKNAKTKRWKAINQLVNGRGMQTWCWGLTGTPTSNELTDAYGQAKLVRPESYPKHFTAFKQETMMQVSTFKWVPRKGAEQTVARVLSPSIRHERKLITDMEPCLIERHAKLSQEQKHHVTQLLREASTEIDGTTVTAVNAAILVQKLIQAVCGVVYGANGEFLKIDFGPRLSVLEEAIEENGKGKVLVFVPFTGALNAVAAELRKKWTVEVVDGGVSAAKRNKIFKDFQETPNPHVLVAHPQCMAHGLDLTRSDMIAWYAPIHNNEFYHQANCRIDGAAQTSKMDILHISSTPTERRIYAVVRERGRLQDVVLDLLKKGV